MPPGDPLPGGVANPDQPRADADAVRFVRSFFEASKPVGVRRVRRTVGV